MIQLFVTGMRKKNCNRKTFTLNDFKESDTIRTLKMVIANKFCVPINLFYMTVGSKTLSEENTFEFYNLANECTVHCNFRAGMGKRISIV
tara:strand:- start:114 stop:383 length:270 start_codon:yes stop_codon:yes gene_type:complete